MSHFLRGSLHFGPEIADGVLVTDASQETAPAVEPLTLSDAKDHLRVDGSADDGHITELIAAARSVVEGETWRALITQTWDAFLDDFPRDGGEIRLPFPPLQGIEQIEYRDNDGDLQTFTDFRVDTAAEPGRVMPDHGAAWPSARWGPQNVRVRFKAGYGDAAGDVPESARHAMRLILSQLYEHREPVVVGQIVTEVPLSAQRLLRQLSARESS